MPSSPVAEGAGISLTRVRSAVIFDFDGLLMDTETTSLQSWQFEWRQWGLELDPTTFFVNHGGDITEDRYAQLGAAVGERFDRTLSHERRVRHRDDLHESLGLTDGIRSWITQAAASGMSLAVASSSPRDWLTRHLGRAEILDQFEVLAGGDEVGRHKPAPDVYELALQRLGLPASGAIAVEDTAHGVDAAHAAGLACIAIPNPFVSPDVVSHAELVLGSAAAMSLGEAIAQCGPSLAPSRVRDV